MSPLSPHMRRSHQCPQKCASLCSPRKEVCREERTIACFSPISNTVMFCEVVLRKAFELKRQVIPPCWTKTQEVPFVNMQLSDQLKEQKRVNCFFLKSDNHFKLTGLWWSKTEERCVVNSKIITEKHFLKVTSDRRRLVPCTEVRYHSATKTSDQMTKQQLPDGLELASYAHSVAQTHSWSVFLGQKSQNRTFMSLWLVNVSRVRLNIKQLLL